MCPDGVFISGQGLAGRLFHEAIKPVMSEHAPGVPYAAGLLGAGSDVLGYDTVRSTDHDWGPRQTLLLRESDHARFHDQLDRMFLDLLPEKIAGYPTRFREFPGEPHIVHMADDTEVSSRRHGINITSSSRLLEQHLGLRSVNELDMAAWLTLSEQQLLEVTSGIVFHDDIGELSEIRQALAWYPEDVWRYRMAAAWKRIAQLEPFVGRTGEVGDDLGSHIIGLSLVRDVMRLAMLQARSYAPYAKWLGSAFNLLPAAHSLMPWLDRARLARTWQEREAGVIGAVGILAKHHNGLALTEPIDPCPRPFHTRPFEVMDAERFAVALTSSIKHPAVRALPKHLGGIDQYMDSTDALVNTELRQVLREWLRHRQGPVQ